MTKMNIILATKCRRTDLEIENKNYSNSNPSPIKLTKFLHNLLWQDCTGLGAVVLFLRETIKRIKKRIYNVKTFAPLVS